MPNHSPVEEIMSPEIAIAAWCGNEKDDAWVSEMVNESDGLSANDS
jgi:hypothetical protein